MRVRAIREKETVSIVVEDDGPGIPAAERSRVVERFYRVDQSRTLPGNGLGLSIVRRIVETAGGTISVQNRTDGGADFAVRFVKAATPTARDENALEHI